MKTKFLFCIFLHIVCACSVSKKNTTFEVLFSDASSLKISGENLMAFSENMHMMFGDEAVEYFYSVLGFNITTYLLMYDPDVDPNVFEIFNDEKLSMLISDKLNFGENLLQFDNLHSIRLINNLAEFIYIEDDVFKFTFYVDVNNSTKNFEEKVYLLSFQSNKMILLKDLISLHFARAGTMQGHK